MLSFVAATAIIIVRHEMQTDHSAPDEIAHRAYVRTEKYNMAPLVWSEPKALEKLHPWAYPKMTSGVTLTPIWLCSN